MSKRDAAVEYFATGYSCAQATAAAFAIELGRSEAEILEAMSGFGGGMGGLRETCGAVSAMVYVAGLRAGSHSPSDKEAKKALYALVKEMAGEFCAEHGTTCCRELLKKAGCQPKAEPSERTSQYYAVRPCARYVASAAGILEKLFVPTGEQGSR